MRTTSARSTIASIQALEPRCLLSSDEPAILNVTVFDDANHNGKRDRGEPTIPGINVYGLSAAKGVYGGTEGAITNSTGVATLRETQGLSKIDVYVEPGPYTLGKYTQRAITLKAGTTQSLDFPLLSDHNTGTITVRLFHDQNHDTTRQGNDEPYFSAGQQVDLRNDSGGQVLQTGTTSADGSVTFTHLNRGRYTAELHNPPRNGENAPLEFLISPFIDVGPDEKASRTVPVIAAVTLSGIAFHDRNGNGKRDSHEALIRNAYVRVFNSGNEEGEGDPDSMPLGGDDSFVRTDAHGHYAKQLWLDWRIYASLIPPDPLLTAILPGSAERALPTPVSLSTAHDYVHNLAFVRPATTGSVTIQTFIDTNEDGLLDGNETVGLLPKKITGITAQLHRTSKHYDDRRTAWAGEGVLFANLRPGTFNIHLLGSHLTGRVTTGNRDPHFTITASQSITFLIGVTPP